MNNAGFTLIELLVVVLIIGVLAAVALPQYQSAVDKARYAKTVPLVRTLKDAAEVYYMANGNYPAGIDMIDVSGPSGCSFPSGDNIVLCEESWYDILNSGELNVTGYTYPRYNTPPNILKAGYRIWLEQSGKAGQRECLALAGERSHRLCRSLGGIRQGTSNVYSLP